MLDGMVVFLQPAMIIFLEVSIIALQLSRESKCVFLLSTVIDSKPLQKENTAGPKASTLAGINNEVKLLHLKNILDVDNQSLMY